VDTAVVGHLPDPAYIGAVALGGIIFNFLFWGFGFLRMGTTGFVAQAHGAGDGVEVRTTLARALLLGIGFGLLLIALQAPIALVAFQVLEGGAALESLAHDYYALRIWGAPATLANYAILGCLIGIQNTQVVLLLQLVLNGVNVALDLLFVMGLGWDVEGVALASVLAEYTATTLGLWILMRSLRPRRDEPKLNPLLDRDRIRVLLHVNLNIFLRTLCLTLAFFYFTAMGARLGEVTLAANAVLMHLQSFLAYGLDGFAHAAEALAGGAYGARDRVTFRAAVRSSSLWALIVAGLYSLVYGLLGTAIIGLTTGIEDVRTTAATYLPWLVLSPLLSVWSFQLDGIFIGATRTVEMRNGMLLSLGVYLIAIWFLMPLLGNHGLWLSLMLFMVARAVTLAVWYPRIERALV
jgi:MATE family multidrug resistance protein